jgi:type IV pilus assembly protein PilW
MNNLHRDNSVHIVRSRGFTLVELMIALVLGLILVGSVGNAFLSIKQSYRTNEALGQIQDGARVAFEFLARDIRHAGLTGCGNQTRVANVLNNSTDWWANWGNALIGFEGNTADPAVATGTDVGERVSGTDSMHLLGIQGSGMSVAKHNPTAANFKLNESSSDLQSGDIIMVCDPDHAAIVQITNYNDSNVTLVHNTGTEDPGNCSKGLGFPTACTENGNGYTYGANSQIAKLSAVDWYIGNNPVGGRSLYRMALTNVGGVATAAAQEMVRNVTVMQLLYHDKSGANATQYVSATGVGSDWPWVDAVRVVLSLASTDQTAGTDNSPLVRDLMATVTLRNRVN